MNAGDEGDRGFTVVTDEIHDSTTAIFDIARENTELVTDPVAETAQFGVYEESIRSRSRALR